MAHPGHVADCSVPAGNAQNFEAIHPASERETRHSSTGWTGTVSGRLLFGTPRFFEQNFTKAILLKTDLWNQLLVRLGGGVLR